MAKASEAQSKHYEYPEQVLEPGTVVSVRYGRAEFGRKVVLDMVAESERVGDRLLGPWPLVNRTIPVRSVRGGAYMWIDPEWIYKTETVDELAAAEAEAIADTADEVAEHFERAAVAAVEEARVARERANTLREKASK